MGRALRRLQMRARTRGQKAQHRDPEDVFHPDPSPERISRISFAREYARCRSPAYSSRLPRMQFR